MHAGPPLMSIASAFAKRRRLNDLADGTRATPESTRALKIPAIHGSELAIMAFFVIAEYASIESGLLPAVVDALPAPEEMIKDRDSEQHIRQFLDGANRWDGNIAMIVNNGFNKLIARVRTGNDDGSIVLFLAKIAREWKSEKWAGFITERVFPNIEYPHYVELAKAGNEQAKNALLAIREVLGHNAGVKFVGALKEIGLEEDI